MGKFITAVCYNLNFGNTYLKKKLNINWMERRAGCKKQNGLDKFHNNLSAGSVIPYSRRE